MNVLKQHAPLLRNALRVSLVVGTVLNLINQGERLLATGELRWGYALMNYLVPFCVATYSGFVALRDETRSARAGERAATAGCSMSAPTTSRH